VQLTAALAMATLIFTLVYIEFIVVSDTALTEERSSHDLWNCKKNTEERSPSKTIVD
jgi:hypothetical protein